MFGALSSMASTASSGFVSEEKKEVDLDDEAEEEVIEDPKDPYIDGPAKNSDLYYVISAIEAQNIITDTFQVDHVSGYGEVSSFVLIKYGQFEFRTETYAESLHPEWNASYVFEYDEEIEEILFMFFSQDLETGKAELFGKVIIPLKEESNPVPVNTPFIRELCPIVPCSSSQVVAELRENHLANRNEPTWPTTKERTIGEATLAVTMLQCNELSEVLKTTTLVVKDLQQVKELVMNVTSNLENTLTSLIETDPILSGRIGNEKKELNPDQRHNFNYPIELSNLCETETENIVSILISTIEERDKLKAEVADLEKTLRNESNDKGGQVKSLQEKNKKLNEDLSKEKTEKKSVEKEFKEASKQIKALTSSLDTATKTGVELSNQVTDLKKIKVNLEDTNKFLVRKGLELAGTGKGGTAFDVGVTKDGDGKTRVDATMLDEYDSTALALRRVAMGASALRQYEGAASYNSEDLTQVLYENLNETMRYFKGEYLSVDSKEILKVSDLLNLGELKCKDDQSFMMESYLKGFGGVRTVAQNLLYGNKSSQAFDIRERWPIEDNIVNKLTVITDAKEVLKSVRTMVYYFDSIGNRSIGDLMYDRGVVLNMEWVIKMAKKAKEVSESNKKGKRSDFMRVFGVLTISEVDDLKSKFSSHSDGKEELSKASFKKLINALYRDQKGKAPKDSDLDAIFKQADHNKSGGVDSEEFLRLYAAVKKGEVKGMAKVDKKGGGGGFLARTNSMAEE